MEQIYMKFNGDIMEENININLKELGEEIAQECFAEHQEDLLIDHIYEEVNYILHNTIKENIIDYALNYLEENDINYHT